MIPDDTTREASLLQLRMLAGLDGSQRLRMALEMSDFVKRLKLSALRSENAGIAETELKKMVIKSCFTSGEGLPPFLQ